jgi:hypothetical protein
MKSLKTNQKQKKVMSEGRIDYFFLMNNFMDITFLESLKTDYNHLSGLNKKKYRIIFKSIFKSFIEIPFILSNNIQIDIYKNHQICLILIEMDFLNSLYKEKLETKINPDIYRIYSKIKFVQDPVIIDYFNKFPKIKEVITEDNFYSTADIYEELDAIKKMGYEFDNLMFIKLISRILDFLMMRKIIDFNTKNDINFSIYKRADVVKSELELRKSIRRVLENSTKKKFKDFEKALKKIIKEHNSMFFDDKGKFSNTIFTNHLTSMYFDKCPKYLKRLIDEFFCSVVKSGDIVKTDIEIIRIFLNVFKRIFQEGLMTNDEFIERNRPTSEKYDIGYGIYGGNYNRYLIAKLSQLLGRRKK